LVAAQGVYGLNGFAAGLIYTAGEKILPAELGSYSVAGQSVALRAARVLLAAQGTYSINGQTVDLVYVSSAAPNTGIGYGNIGMGTLSHWKHPEKVGWSDLYDELPS
jgi:hypothetical protein